MSSKLAAVCPYLQFRSTGIERYHHDVARTGHGDLEATRHFKRVIVRAERKAENSRRVETEATT